MKEDKTEWGSTRAQPCCSSEVMQCSMSAVHVSQADTEEKMAQVTLVEVL